MWKTSSVSVQRGRFGVGYHVPDGRWLRLGDLRCGECGISLLGIEVILLLRSAKICWGEREIEKLIPNLMLFTFLI